MDTPEILQKLDADGLTWHSGPDVRLYVPPHLVRFTDRDGALGIAAGGEVAPLSRATVLADALHVLHTLHPSQARLQIIYGSHDGDTDVVAAVHTLVDRLTTPVEVEVLRDFTAPPAADLSIDAETITRSREALDADRGPTCDLSRALHAAVDDPALSWSGAAGLIDGLQVCTVDGDQGVLAWGGPGLARRRFEALIEDAGGQFGSDDVPEVAEALQRVAADRAKGRLAEDASEARTVARVLRGASPIPDMTALASHVPVRWSAAGPARTADLVLAAGDVPVVASVVAGPGGVTADFRRALCRAALDSAYFRRATDLHPWFAARGLDATRTRALLVFCRLTSARGRKRLEDLQRIADALEVGVAQVRR